MRFFSTRHKFGWVAGATGGNVGEQATAGHGFCGLNDLLNRIACAVAEIVDQGLVYFVIAFFNAKESIEAKYMGIG
jgi:hypothetical protein